MTSKNIFDVLSDEEENDDFKQTKPKTQKDNEKKPKSSGKEAPKKTDNSGKPGQSKGANSGVSEQTQKEQTQKEKNTKDGPKSKGVSSEPHPQDRKSGTGRGKEIGKQGAGRRNWGTFKDDQKDFDTRIGEGENGSQGEEEQEEEVQLTLEEYRANNNLVTTEQKSQVVVERNEKELQNFAQKEKLEVVSKKDLTDDLKSGKVKQKQVHTEYKVNLNTSNADLLGLKSGFVAQPQRKGGPKKEYNKDEKKPYYEKKEKADENAEQKEQNAENQVEGEAKDGENQENQQNEGQRGGYRGRGDRGNRGGRGGRGGGRGGRGGYDRGNDEEGGYGNRRGGYGNNRGGRGGDYKQKEEKKATAFVEDESSFPKLG